MKLMVYSYNELLRRISERKVIGANARKRT